MTDFRQFLKVSPCPTQVFSHDAQVDCVGVHIRAGGLVVGQVIGSEIENGELILTVAIDKTIPDEGIDNFRHPGFD